MKLYIILIYFILSCLITSCNDFNNKQHNKNRIENIEKVQKNVNYQSAYDSIENIKIDTTTLIGKRNKIVNEFLLENGLIEPDYDSLIDLTYDGFKDYVLGYYGKSGTGIKNRVKVLFFEPQLNSYILNKQLSDLPNPSFYIKDKKITGFYIGNGGGGGQKLEWIRNKWTTTMEFEVNNEGDTTKWKINYPIKNKKEVLIRPFKGIPPNEILETDIKY